MLRTLPAIALSVLALAASASAHARNAPSLEPAAPMQLGAAAPAPIGYIEFCQSLPSDCTAAPPAAASFDKSYWNLAFQQAQHRTDTSPKPASMRRSFRGSRGDYGKRALATPSTERSSSDVGEKIVLTRRAWDDLQRVNSRVNAEVTPTSDAKLYGVDDRWSLPQVGRSGRMRGDCEDYVLEKRHQLLERGYPQAALSIALVHTRWGEHHAVLLVETTSGAYVLDSLNPWIRPWTEVDYQWVIRQSPSDAGKWVNILPTDASAPRHKPEA